MATVQYSTTVRDAMANAKESAIGTAPTLELWSGALPANCAAADAGSKIAEGVLPSDWLTAASGNGLVGKNGTWTLTGLAAAGGGTDALHFRIRKSGTVHMQGDVSEAGGGGAMIIDNTNVAEDQVVNVTQFDLQTPNG